MPLPLCSLIGSPRGTPVDHDLRILQGGCRYQGPYALCAPVVVEAIRFSVRVRAPVVRSVARRSEVLAAAIDVAGIQPLTSVPALVRLQVAQLREAFATALVVACIWLLIRVRTFVRHMVG
jgi:predicted nucleic acid-binding protein